MIEETDSPVADTKGFKAAAVYSRRTRQNRRELRYLRNKETAAEAIAGLDRETEIFGFTKGQFGLIALLSALRDKTGPAEMYISTWTAARYEIQKILDFVQNGKILRARWLVDLTFQRRDKGLAALIRKQFGADSIRVAQTHAKFTILENDTWRLVVRTSMNLNMNPRFEDFTIAHDPELADFLGKILDELWTRQAKELAYTNTKAIQRAWRDF